MKNLIVFGAGSGDDIAHFKTDIVPGETDWTVWAFEPGPRRFDDLEYRFQYVDSIKCINAAVGVSDNTIKLYEAPGPNSRSTNPGKAQLNLLKYDEVPQVDVRRWMVENIKKDDLNIMVIDIEGAEYNVVDAMKDHNLLDWIDELYIEFHGEKIADFDMQRELDMVEMLKEHFGDKVYIFRYYQHDKFLELNAEGVV